MGFIIVDLSNEDYKLFATLWNWHPTVNLIQALDLLDSERLEMMHYQMVGVEVSKDEAQVIGSKLQAWIHSNLSSQDRVLWDLTTTTEPDDLKMHYDDTSKNYSASYDWLNSFVEFCLSSQGFKVI